MHVYTQLVRAERGRGENEWSVGICCCMQTNISGDLRKDIALYLLVVFTLGLSCSSGTPYSPLV